MPKPFAVVVFAVLALAVLPAALPAQTDWRRLQPANEPSPRCCTDMAFDEVRSRAVIFGGFVAGVGFVDETWEWDGATWQQASPGTRPPARDTHALAWDSVRGRVLLFGGGTDAMSFGDTWEWDGTTWTLRSSAGPSPRQGHGMAFDRAAGCALMFGGGTTAVGSAETWQWDGVQWTQRAPATVPPRRWLHAMAYDERRGVVVMFGGRDPVTKTFRGDTWEWDGSDWIARTPAASPSPRMRHDMTWDAARQRVVLFGGEGPNGLLGDTWEWDGTTWLVRTPANAPSARRMTAIAFDRVAERVVLFGGVDARGFPAGTWDYGTTAPASYLAYGSGCVGSAGTPTMVASAYERPWIGESFTSSVTMLPMGAPATLAIGSSRTTWNGITLPLDLSAFGAPTCMVLTSPDLMVPLVSRAGIATLSLRVPATVLPGQTFFVQAVVLDAVNALGVTTSDARAGMVGAK